MLASTAIYRSIVRPAIVGGAVWLVFWLLAANFGWQIHPKWPAFVAAMLAMFFWNEGPKTDKTLNESSPIEAGLSQSDNFACASVPEFGSTAAQKLYSDGHHQKAIASLEREANAGNIASQYYLGEAIYNGTGTPKHSERGAQLILEAARSGFSDAQNFAGVMLSQGAVGFGKDEQSALVYLEAAAMQNHADACANLGNTYLLGIGVRVDVDTAAKYFQRALKLGSSLAETMLEIYPEMNEKVRALR